jgi:hypothetical protein
LKSNALIATRLGAIKPLVVEGAESLALRALATALRVWRDCGGAHGDASEIFTIRPPLHWVKRRNEDELRRPPHKCDLELRGGVVKAAARQGRAQRES